MRVNQQIDRQTRSRHVLPTVASSIAARLLLSAAAAGWWVGGAFAQQHPTERDLREAVSVMAERIVQTLQPQGQNIVVIGEFRNEFDMTITGGTQIRRLLIEMLMKHQVTTALSGEISVTGSIEKVMGEDHSLTGERPRKIPVALISYKITRRNGEILLDSTKLVESERAMTAVTKPNDVFAILGGNGAALPELGRDADVHSRDQAFDNLFDNSSVSDRIEIRGARIRPKGQPFAVEILVAPRGPTREAPQRSAYKAVTPEFRDGLPFITIQPGQVYAVRLVNEADFDMAAVLTIDGLDMFSFRDPVMGTDGKPVEATTSSFVIIPPKKQGDILGWFRNNQKSDTFLVRDLVDGPLGDLLKDPGGIGSITLAFHAAWEKDPPADERRLANLKNVGSVETAPGAPIDAPYETVKRSIGVLRSGVTIRYDKH